MKDTLNKKRVLIFSVAYHPLVGGAEVAVREVTKRLTQEIDFHLVTLRIKDSAKKEVIDGVVVHRIGVPVDIDSWFGKIIFTGEKHLFPLLGFLKGYCLHKQQQFDVVWGMMANYAGMAATLFKLIVKNVQFLLTLQEGDPISYIKRRALPVYPLFLATFKKADVVQVISTYLADFARSMGAKNVHIIPNGVDVDHFAQYVDMSPREEFGYNNDDVVLVTTSRLVKKNGIEYVIRALSGMAASVKFLIVGVGELEYKLKALAEDLGVSDRVKFVGLVQHEDIPKYLNASDIFIRPSLTEGMGNSFVEAMAAGIPVIATPVGGIPDIVQDGVTGVFCKPQDVTSIVDSVQKLQDASFRHTIIQQGKSFVRDFHWDIVAKKMKNIIV